MHFECVDGPAELPPDQFSRYSAWWMERQRERLEAFTKHMNAELVAPLEDCYCPDFGRPAIHLEVMVTALLVGSVYNVAPFRRLCSANSEKIAYRWFCFLTIDDPVFDHSSIRHFIHRIGRDGFAAIFEGLKQQLLRLGLLSPGMYPDASLVKGNSSSFEMVPIGMTVAEFQELSVEANGLFVLTEISVDDDGVDDDGVQSEEVRHFQDPKGRLPLNPVDTDARRRASSPKRPAELCCQDNVIVDLSEFIVARGVTHASGGEWKAIPQFLEKLPIHPVSLTMDTGYSAGNCGNSLWTEASGPTFRCGPSRRTAYWGQEASPTRRIDWSVPRVRNCIGTGSTKRNSAICTQRGGKTAKRVRSGTIAFRPDKSADTFRSPGTTR